MTAGMTEEIKYQRKMSPRTGHYKRPKFLSGLYGEPSASALMLEDIAVFPESPKIADIKDELEFVPKNNPKWGSVMQRGGKNHKQKGLRTHRHCRKFCCIQLTI